MKIKSYEDKLVKDDMEVDYYVPIGSVNNFV